MDNRYQMMIKTYSELIRLKTFDERFMYLKLNGMVGDETFGFDRILNQKFYITEEWKRCRRDIILRDNGCDLGILTEEIRGRIIVHHINTITVKDLQNRSEKLFDPENLISSSILTHNAIHYGDHDFLTNNKLVERCKNDTCPWRH